MPAKTHGHSAGGSTTPTYNAWQNMRARCQDPNHPKYPRYGGRGIRVCSRWDVFENFLADMGEKPKLPDNLSIGRRDNDGDYEPGNCSWEVVEQQVTNKSNNVFFTRDDGVSKTIPDWAREFGISQRALYYRLANHGTIFNQSKDI